MKELLEDKELCLRALEPEDLPLLYKWENDTSLWEAGSSIAPFSRKILWDYIESYSPDIYAARQLRLMIVEKAIGRGGRSWIFIDFVPRINAPG